MTEKILNSELSDVERKIIFKNNYKEIIEKVKRAAEKSGRNFDDIIILAATKTVDVDVINYAINNGIKYIGENRVQEFLSKADYLYSGAERHFIGHLQTNKVKDIVGKVSLIHSVDSVKLAKAISEQSKKMGIVSDILLEVNIGNETSKSGFLKNEIIGKMEEIVKFDSICVKGLMAIPPVCQNNEKNREYFKEMYNLFLDIQGKKMDNSSMEFLSMGMSDDFDVAIEEGANIVRIGTALFGKRNYNI